MIRKNDAEFRRLLSKSTLLGEMFIVQPVNTEILEWVIKSDAAQMGIEKAEGPRVKDLPTAMEELPPESWKERLERIQWPVYTVDFENLVQRLREMEIDSFIKETFGKAGHRLVQMMRRDGKLDQTHLPNAALLQQRNTRIKLAEMQMGGVVEVQGVPRDSAHSVNRMIFLWYFSTFCVQ